MMSQLSDLFHRQFVFTLDGLVWVTAAILATAAFLYLLERAIRGFYVGDIDRKYVLITGCDTGFGRNAALRLDRLGCHVFAGCLTDDGARSLREEASKRLLAVKMDVRDIASIKEVLEFVKRSLPPDTGLWGLVNNAGVLGVLGPMDWHSREDMQATFDVNVFGLGEVTRHFLPLVKKAKGRIVNTSSVVGYYVLAYTGPYCMSKHAVEALSDAYRLELHPFGVSVHIIEPGVHRTPFLDTDRLKAAARKLWEKQTPAVKEEYGEKYLEHLIWQVVELMPKVGATNLHNVPKAYEHALFSYLPKKRYTVGFDSALMITWACLPSILSDWIYRMPLMRNIPAACQK